MKAALNGPGPMNMYMILCLIPKLLLYWSGMGGMMTKRIHLFTLQNGMFVYFLIHIIFGIIFFYKDFFFLYLKI